MSRKRKIAIILLILFFIGFLFGVYKYWKFSREYATTDAVFIRSDKITNLSFKRVKGKIKNLFVKEGDIVKKGELLAEIDPVDYKLEYKIIKDKINSLKEKKDELLIKKERVNAELKFKKRKIYKNINILQQKVKAMDYQIKATSVNIEQLKRDYLRYKNLYNKNVIAKRDYELIETKLKALQEKKFSLIHQKESLNKQIEMIKYDLKIVNEEFKQVKEIEKSFLSLNSQIKSLKAKLKDIKHSIDYCKLYAPFNGAIGKKFVEIGMNVKSGNPIYSLVDKKDLYVEVLLEETKLKGVKPGCRAFFKVDSFKNIEFQGIVEKIYPASAATYALVPRDISAGEFTKVAQRIVIRVKITKGNKSLLIPGMGGEIKIKRINNG